MVLAPERPVCYGDDLCSIGLSKKPASLCSEASGPHMIPLHSCQDLANGINTLVPP